MKSVEKSPASPQLQMYRGTLGILLAESLVIPAGLCLAAVLTRSLGPERFGLFILSVVVVTWFEWTLVSLFSRSTVKFISEARDWRPLACGILQNYFLAALAVIATLWALSPALARLLDEPDLSYYLRVFAWNILPFSLAAACRSILTGLRRYTARAGLSACRWVARLLFTGVLLISGFSIAGALVAFIAASVSELLLAWVLLKIPLRGPSSRFPLRQFWIFSIPLFLFSISLRLMDRVDLLVLKALQAGPAEAGYYGAAQNLTVLPGIFALAFAPLLLSTLSYLRAGQELEAARKLVQNSLRPVFLLLPFAALGAGAADEIVLLVLGTHFADSAPLFSILIFRALGIVMISVCGSILAAADKPIWAALLVLPFAVLAFPGYFFAIPRLGGIGAALVTCGAALVCATAAVLAVARCWKIVPPALGLLQALVIAGLTYWAAAAWITPGYLLFLKLLLLGAAVPAVYLLVGAIRLREVAQLRRVLGFR